MYIFNHERLKVIRESVIKVSQKTIALLCGISQRDVSQLESGKKKFLPLEYIQFLNTKGIDLNVLFGSDEDFNAFVSDASYDEKKMRSNLRSNLRSNSEKNIKSDIILEEPRVEYIPVLVDKHGNENIIFVDIKSAAGFGAIVNNEKALSEYPVMALPGFMYRGRKQYVAFETEGDSMHPTIQHKDIIITSRIEKLTDIKNGYVYTIVCDGAINTKRLHYVSGDDYVDCISDNEVYEPFKQPINEITAIYRAEGLVRTQFRNWNNDLRRDLSILRLDVERIKRKIDL